MGVFTGLSNRPQQLKYKTGAAQKQDMRGLHRIIQRAPTVGTENRSGTKTGHGGLHRIIQRAPTVGIEKEHTLPQQCEII
jgi:hypothetical protein